MSIHFNPFCTTWYFEFKVCVETELPILLFLLNDQLKFPINFPGVYIYV